MPDLFLAFPYIENSGLNLVLLLAKPLTFYSHTKFLSINKGVQTKPNRHKRSNAKNRYTTVNIVL